MRPSFLLPPLCLALATLAGCGNKGPLVLPPARPAAAAPVAPPAAPAAPSSAPAPAGTPR